MLRRLDAFFAMALLLAGCQAVPLTGRSQLMLLDEGSEMAMGLSSFEKFQQEHKPSRDPRFRAIVDQVGRRIAAATGRKDYQWEFMAVDSDEINAFCLPGGKVVVYGGIMRVAGSEGGLAVVVGHEVAHAVARHGGERVSQNLLAQLGLTAAGAVAAVQSDDPATAQIAMAALGAGVTYGLLMPYSRLQESEADRLGLIFMARAGYDPRAAPAFWQRMSQAKAAKGGGGTPEFLSTHPADETRIADIRKHLPEAMAQYRPAK